MLLKEALPLEFLNKQNTLFYIVLHEKIDVHTRACINTLSKLTHAISCHLISRIHNLLDRVVRAEHHEHAAEAEEHDGADDLRVHAGPQSSGRRALHSDLAIVPHRHVKTTPCFPG